MFGELLFSSPKSNASMPVRRGVAGNLAVTAIASKVTPKYRIAKHHSNKKSGAIHMIAPLIL
jgi:hypothetical protein